MPLAHLLDLSLIGRASAHAFEYEVKDGTTANLTFGEINLRCHRVSQLLRAHGIERGDRIALLLPNRIEFIDLFLACLKTGIIVVPINILYREREIKHILDDAQPKLVVTTNQLKSLIADGTPVWEVESLMAAASQQAPPSLDSVQDGDDTAAIVYTSGTTGLSKGAMLSGNNFAVNTVNLLTAWKITSEDRYLGVLPLFHVHGLGNGVLCWLVSGCVMRLAPRFEIDRAIELFDAFRPSLFFGVPTIYVRLLELPDEFALRAGKYVRLFVSGSAPLPAHTLEAFHAKFGHSILERYGMSETLMNTSNPYEGERRPGSVGFPLPGVSIKLIDPAGQTVVNGAVGEVLLRGSNVFRGYWRKPEATAEAFIDGWFRTGDLAERSEDGYYALKGRRTEMIISGGFNIYPREIEDLLLEHPGVREVAVCGVPNERRGEVPVAYLVVDGPFDPAALEEVCRRSLATFKVPRAFIQVESLPRTALGKVQKKLLPPPPKP